MRKGVILAGGSGTRLGPVSTVVSKQLSLVYDKPLVFYPLTTLILAGITDVLVICRERDLESFRLLLGDGSQFGISIDFAVQSEPKGIAEAPIIAQEFTREEDFTLVLGDNIFFGPGFGRSLAGRLGSPKSLVFGIQHPEPQRFGVVHLASDGTPKMIEEKPITNLGNPLVIPGLYKLDGSAAERASKISPSARGELEIVDLLISYLNDGQLEVQSSERGSIWFDTGTPESLHDAATMVRLFQENQGVTFGSPIEAAAIMGRISLSEVEIQANSLPKGTHKNCLESFVAGKKNGH